MNCPKCNAKLLVTHTYQAGNAGTTRRMHCKKCFCVVTTVTVITEINPIYGNGPGRLALEAKTPADLFKRGPVPVKEGRTGATVLARA